MTEKKFHILLSLKIRGDTKKNNAKTIEHRLYTTLDCESVLISVGEAKKVQYDYLCGIILKATDSSKSTSLSRRIKTLFEDMECDLRFKKGWGPICLLFAVQVDFLVFGRYSREEIMAVAHATRRHKQPIFKKNMNLISVTKKKSFGCQSSFAPRRRIGFVKWKSWSWLVKRAVFGTFIYQFVSYFFKTVIEPCIPIILICISDAWNPLFRSIFEWPMGE
jgi:hypothetical protein